MNQKEYQGVVDAFEKYYDSFSDKSNKMVLKYQHSYNVADYMMELAKRLKLSKSDQYLAKTIGLLHDIGRFEQLREFNSFSDQLFDHAEFGVKYLFDDNHIRDFTSNDINDSVIKNAILNHNKMKIDSKLKDRELMFSHMIRDMDKVDIYYQVATMLLPKFDEKPRKKVLDALYKGKCVYKTDVKTNGDKVVQMIAFLNDIHYKESMDILKESDNLYYYLCSIDVSDKYREMFNDIVKFCQERAGMRDLDGK